MAVRICSAPLSVADAMYAPVCTRFRTYAVPLDPALAKLLRADLRLAADAGMDRGAVAEPDEIVELEVEF